MKIDKDTFKALFLSKKQWVNQKYLLLAANLTGQRPEHIMISGKTLFSKVPVSEREAKGYIKSVEQIRRKNAQLRIAN